MRLTSNSFIVLVVKAPAERYFGIVDVIKDMSKNKESTELTLDDLLKMTVTPKHIHQIVRRMNEPNFTDYKLAPQ